LPWILAGVGALVLLLVAGGIAVAVSLSGSKPRPVDAIPTPGVTHLAPPPFTGGPTRGTPTTDPSSAAATGPGYQVDTDFCGKLKHTSLSDWAVRNDRSDAPRKHGTGMSNSYEVDCRDEFKNGPPGRFSSVDVRAQIYASPSDAQDGYKILHDIDRSRFDKDLPGYGDDAYGTYRTWTPGFNTSEYTINIRSGNLVLIVHVSVSQDTFIPKETMLTRVGPEAKAIMSLVPKA
jgi:hypothetical protein